MYLLRFLLLLFLFLLLLLLLNFPLPLPLLLDAKLPLGLAIPTLINISLKELYPNPSPLLSLLPGPMCSTTPPPSPATESSSDGEPMLRDGDSDLEYANIMQTGLGHMLDNHTPDYFTLDQVLEYAFKTSCHDGEPQSFYEAMQCPAQEHNL
jgi:hypothetical protein